MPVPNTMADLSTLAGSNSPAGSETVFPNLDDYLRALSAIVRSTNAVSASTIAAASTTNIAGSSGESVQVTGAATITSLGTGYAGCRREVRFAGACLLTNSTNLQLWGGNNYTTSAGDTITFRCIAAGQWICVGGTPAPVGALPANLQAWNAILPATKADDSAVVHRTGLLDESINGLKNFSSAIRSSGLTSPSAGSGTEIAFGSGLGYVLAFDRTAAAYLPLTVRGSTLDLWSNGSSSLLLNTAANFAVGAKWGSVISGSATDLSNHISLWGTLFGFSITTGSLNLVSNGSVYAFQPSALVVPGDITAASGALTVGGGKKLSKITVSTSAPGALADGELFLRY